MLPEILFGAVDFDPATRPPGFDSTRLIRPGQVSIQ
jgi:hypothetical protein